jgi:hypothetical protein
MLHYDMSIDDSEKVLAVLNILPTASVRMIADALDWRLTTGKLNTFRVHQAIMALALDKRIAQVDKRWRVCK